MDIKCSVPDRRDLIIPMIASPLEISGSHRPPRRKGLAPRNHRFRSPRCAPQAATPAASLKRNVLARPLLQETTDRDPLCMVECCYLAPHVPHRIHAATLPIRSIGLPPGRHLAQCLELRRSGQRPSTKLGSSPVFRARTGGLFARVGGGCRAPRAPEDMTRAGMRRLAKEHRSGAMTGANGAPTDGSMAVKVTCSNERRQTFEPADQRRLSSLCSTAAARYPPNRLTLIGHAVQARPGRTGTNIRHRSTTLLPEQAEEVPYQRFARYTSARLSLIAFVRQ
jgi:hypothetical protein